MSNPPPPPYDPNQPPYGQIPYGQSPYPAAPYGQVGYSQAAAGLDPWGRPILQYASWLARVGATLVDTLLYLLGMAPLILGFVLAVPPTETDPVTGLVYETGPAINADVGWGLVVFGFVVYLGLILWNACYRQGVTGASVGKQVLGIRVMREADGRPQGFWASLGRLFLHSIVDGSCYLGYLWPLWDGKRQTFTDKIMSTVVVKG